MTEHFLRGKAEASYADDPKGEVDSPNNPSHVIS